MRKIFFPLLLTLGFSVSGAELKLDFNSYSAGETPTNFSSVLAGNGAPGGWKVVSDEAAPSFSPLMPEVAPTPSVARNHVLGQLNQDATDDRFPIFVYNGQSFKNFTAAMRFKLVAGTAERMAGMVFRYQNVSNFYVVRASALGQNVRFYKVVDGKFADPATPFAINITPGVWHTLIVQCEGNRVTCRLDNTAMPSIQTMNTLDSGKIGFWTKSDAVSYFESMTIDYTPTVPAAQTLVRDILKQYPRIIGMRIYMPDEKGELKVVGSKDESEIGQAGVAAENDCYQKGAVFYGHGKGTVDVDMPLNDRNGEPVAAVRIQLKSNFLAETQEMVLNRVRIIINEMQKHVLSKEDLM